MTGRRPVEAIEHRIGPAVSETLGSLDLGEQDAAAARLAEKYATALDDATGVLGLVADELRDIKAEMKEADETLRQRVTRCENAVEAQRILEALGPKLLAVLSALGATPQARAAAVKGGSDGPNRLDLIRQARRGR